MSEPTPPARSELATRSLVGAALLVLAVAALWLGGLAFNFLVLASVLLMVAEYCGLSGAGRAQTRIAMVLAAAGLLVGASFGISARALVLGTATIIGLGALFAIISRRVTLGLGLVYTVLPGLALVWLRAWPNGFAFVLWVLTVVWATDIFAYFTGRAFGGRKLAPRISPGKTWSGLFGGMAAAALVGWIVASAYRLDAPFTSLGAAMAVAAQGGDLFESWLKRQAGAKDSGLLLPGHGGALDRLDGLIPVALLTALVIAAGWWPL